MTTALVFTLLLLAGVAGLGLALTVLLVGLLRRAPGPGAEG